MQKEKDFFRLLEEGILKKLKTVSVGGREELGRSFKMGRLTVTQKCIYFNRTYMGTGLIILFQG